MLVDPECDLCGGTGEMTWQQPVPGPDGEWVLRQLSHPCTRGCGGWWKPAVAEVGHFQVDDPGVRAGNVARANRCHRTEWTGPAPTG